MSDRFDHTTTKSHDANRDPITGQPGAHPVGVGVGAAAAGAAVGAVGGAMGGPIGAAVGAVVGGLAGGLAGKDVAEHIDPTEQDAYWRENYANRSYYDEGTSYDDYAPAYRYGWESRTRHEGKNWNDVEADLKQGWNTSKANSSLTWDRAHQATRDAWDRADNQIQLARAKKPKTGV